MKPANDDLVPTGVGLLDAALEGGVRPGTFVFALGEPTSGMELLTKQFAASGAEDEKVLVFAADESEAEWRTIMGRFGTPKGVEVVDIASQYYDRVYRPRDRVVGDIRMRPILPTGGKAKARLDDIPDFLDEVVAATTANTPARTVIDTLDFFTELYEPGDIVRSLRALRIVNRDAGGILLVTKMKGTSDRSLETILEHVADVVLDFQVEPSQQQFSWSLTIRKVRNEPQKAGTVLYNPTPQGLARDTRRRV